MSVKVVELGVAELATDQAALGGSLSRDAQPAGPASASGKSRPLLRASRRQMCSVASEIPSSLASCRNGTAFGGSSFLRTAARRSVE